MTKHRVPKAVAALAAVTLLAGCVATPPRANYRDDAYYRRDSGYRTSGYQNSGYDCARCGVVREVGRVYVRDNQTSGGGAVLGAIIGGVLGSTVGKGDGRTAATVAGAVAGGFAGNAVERNSNDRGGREAWQFEVALDDGRYARVTQWDNNDLRPGDRVMIRNDRLVHLR